MSGSDSASSYETPEESQSKKARIHVTDDPRTPSVPGDMVRAHEGRRKRKFSRSNEQEGHLIKSTAEAHDDSEPKSDEQPPLAISGHIEPLDSTEAKDTLKRLLKYCQEVVTKQDVSNYNIMDNVMLYGKDFEEIGLEASDADDWFCVNENEGGKLDALCLRPTNQRQLFYELFNYQRRSKLDGGEIICGIGIVRHLFVDDTDNFRRLWHPIILVHLDIREENGRILVAPSQIHSPTLWSMAPLCAGDDQKQSDVKELEERFHQHLQSLEVSNTQLSPFDRTTYARFLDHFRRVWRGEPVTASDSPLPPANNMSDSERESAIERYWQELRMRPLEVVDEWVIYTQAGDLSTCKKDIQGFISQFEEPRYRPPPWADFLARMFVDMNKAKKNHAAPLQAEGREWLFPLASNKQQQDIADMLRQSHTVVVQGPPGTGKTHTLANVVCDAVAHGQRVLVVSTGQHALEVFLEKLPEFIKSVAMFFGDGGQMQDQTQAIRAVETIRKVIEDSARPEWVAQASADMQHVQQTLEDTRSRITRFGTELQLRAALFLKPLAQAVLFDGRLHRRELKRPCELREKICAKLGQSTLKRKNLMHVVTLMSVNDDELSSSLDEVSHDGILELRTLVTDLIHVLPVIFQTDLYQALQESQKKLLAAMEDLATHQLRCHIVACNDKLPAASILAYQFLEELKAGQGKGRGHQARHWKLARDILVGEQGLVESFPLWIMTTNMVSELLPSKFSLFDIVAIDEASKSEIFELPALLRGKKVLVIGDNKQVSPNDLAIGERRLHELERLRSSITKSRALQCAFAPGKSIFDLFYGFHLDRVKILREHFRCTQAIIRFCNENFYNGELEPLRVSTSAKRLIPPILCNERNIGGQGSDNLPSREEVELILKQMYEGLVSKRNEQLKEECRARRLNVSGNKQGLIQRIMDYERSAMSGKDRGRSAAKASKQELDDHMINEVTSVFHSVVSSQMTKKNSEQVINILSNNDESMEKLPDGSFVERSIGLIFLGVGQEADKISKKLAKKLKDHPKLGDEVYYRHKIRCGGPADFQGDEKDILLAALPSKQLINNINIDRWEQAINVAVSRAKERFHLFHQLLPGDMRCIDNDPRLKLIKYCEKAVRDFKATMHKPRLDMLKGFALDVASDLTAVGVDVRTCGEILPLEWKDKMLVVEGARRMVAVVLNGSERQTFELWQVESQKWTVLCRVNWRVVECWRFQYLLNRSLFVENLLQILFEEEGVGRYERLDAPLFQCSSTKPYIKEISVFIHSAKGSTVLYSMDGSKPTLEYNDSRPLICCVGSTTIKAVAQKPGFIDSDVISETFDVLEQVAEPVIKPFGDGPFTTSVRVEIICETKGAEIWYTLDGTLPSADFHSVYGGEDLLLHCKGKREVIEVRAIGVKLGVMANSELKSRRFILQPATSEPEILMPISGLEVDTMIVKIKCKTPNASIYFTTNGVTTPSAETSRYEPEGIVISRTGVVVKALAVASGCGESQIVESQPVIVRACKPTFTPHGGILASSAEVALSCTSIGATIQYCTERGSNRSEWTTYCGPIKVRESRTVICALARKCGLENSEEARSFPFIIRAERPAFEPSAGCYEDSVSVKICCRASGNPSDIYDGSDVIIYYTIDGSQPTKNSTSCCDGDRVVLCQDNAVLRAFASKPGYADSDEASSAPFQIRAAQPIFEPDGGSFDQPVKVTIRCANSNMWSADPIIRYTMDGSCPTIMSTVYLDTKQIWIERNNTVIRARAWITGKAESEVASSRRFTLQSKQKGRDVIRSSVPDVDLDTKCDIESPFRDKCDGAQPEWARQATKLLPSQDLTETFHADDATQFCEEDESTLLPRDWSNTETSCATARAVDALAPFTLEYRPATGESPRLLKVGSDVMQYVIGRGTQSHFRVENSNFVSRRHCTLTREAGAVILQNFGRKSCIVIGVDGSEVWVGSGEQLARGLQIGDMFALDRKDGDEQVYLNSFVIAQDEKITSSAPLHHDVVARPSVSPDGGRFESVAKVVLKCTTAGATIRYTLDGTCPSASPSAHTCESGCEAVEILQSCSAVRVVALKSGMQPSEEVISQPFIIQAARPTFDPDGGDFEHHKQAFVRCATIGAEIYYTVDGTPATRRAERCSGSVMVTKNGARIRAVAVAAGMEDSEEATSNEFRFPWCVLTTADRSDSTSIWPPHTEFIIGRVGAGRAAGSFKLINSNQISRCHCILRWLPSSGNCSVQGTSSCSGSVILEDLSSNGLRGAGTCVNGRPVPRQDRPAPGQAQPMGLSTSSSISPGSGTGPWRWTELHNGDSIALLLISGVEHYVFNVTLL